jgi:putative peptidoglycan lipid II flippase
VEIRTAPSDNPDLDQTNAIGQATLAAGDTRIPVQKPVSTRRILVWITGLASTGQGWAAELDHIAFLAR